MTVRGRLGYTKYFAFDSVVANVDAAFPLGQSGAYLTGSFNAFFSSGCRQKTSVKTGE